MRELTPRQNQILEMIQDFIDETGMPPTRAEIARELGFKSANAAEEHLRALQKKGVIELVPGASRGIQLKDSLREQIGLPLVGRVAAGQPILAEQNIEARYRLDPSLFHPKPHYLLRVHGMKPRYHHKIVGINSRLDSIQAAILKIKFPHLETWTGQRTTNAARYDKLFAAAKLAKLIELPVASRECRHVWNQYVIRVPADHRDALRAHLQARKIGTEVYYPVPLHKQECFEVLGTAGDPLPETNRAATEVIALPVAPGLTEAQQESVVEAIAGYFHEQGLLTGSGSAIKGPNFLKSAG